MNFIQPEVYTLRYWLHLGLVATITLGILQLLFHGEMLTLRNVIYSIPIVGIADVVTHGIFAKIGYST
jgi:hypothetical protein